MPKCPKCDTVVAKTAQRCPSCGAKFRSQAAEPEDDFDDLDEIEDDRPVRKQARGGKKKSSSSSSTTTVLIVVACLGVVSLCLCAPIFLALTLPAVQQAREAARSTQSRNNLKQIGLAAHNFHDTFNKFPPRGVGFLPGAPSADLEPNMVTQAFLTDILPYLDQAPLYTRLQRDKGWMDPANQQSFSTVIPTYLHPSVTGSPLNPQGYAVAHYATNSKAISDITTTRLSDITDGTSNTMLAGTLNDGFKAWGDPTNHRDPSLGFGGGPQAFGAPNRRTATILLFDGSVRNVNVDLSSDICKKLADPRDGQPVGEF